MTKEILIKVQMKCHKCRTKAMKLIAAAQGVDSVAIEGEDKDRFRVTGDNIDCVKLTRTLRKKVGNGLTRTLRKKEGHADLVSVQEVKKKEAKAKEEPKEKEAEAYFPHPHVVYYHREYPDLCSIM